MKFRLLEFYFETLKRQIEY